MLCDKYIPYTLNGIIGNEDAVSKLVEFSAEAQVRKVKPIFIFGPPGTGKTAAAHAIAYSGGFELLELNASDYRDAATLKKLLLPASHTGTLTHKKLLVLFDEIDELSEKFDVGAQGVILKFISESSNPIVFVGNDFWSQKVSFLRNYVEKVEFKRIPKEKIAARLKYIAKKEGKNVEESTIETIAAMSNGDMRAALNDLELIFDAKPELLENIGTRSYKLEIFEILDKIFSSRNFYIAKDAVANSDISLDMLLNWVDENIPNRYIALQELAASYEMLAAASRFIEKAERTSYYGYLRYASILLSSGVALANNGHISTLRRYSFPKKIKQLSETKTERALLSSIASKLGRSVHSNKSEIIQIYMPLFGAMLKSCRLNGIDGYSFFESEYGIEKEEAKAIEELYGA
ncbi:MAG: replication factor C large subunit [Candidatus Micrarchaeaceae archaeon]